MISDHTPSILRRWHEQAPNHVLLDGFHALKHALRFDARVSTAVTSDKESVLALAADLADDLSAAIEELVVEIPAAEFKGLLPRLHPTRVAALAEPPDERETGGRLYAPDRRSPVIVLDNPRNLGNVGAVVRLAAGIGATGVVTTGELDPWHPNVVRASAGLHYATAVRRLDLGELPAGELFALDPEGTDIRSISIPDDALIVFGSERHGISRQMRAKADRLLALPMRPQVSSYNLATSVAMTMFHWAGSSEVFSASNPDIH